MNLNLKKPLLVSLIFVLICGIFFTVTVVPNEATTPLPATTSEPTQSPPDSKPTESEKSVELNFGVVTKIDLNGNGKKDKILVTAKRGGISRYKIKINGKVVVKRNFYEGAFKAYVWDINKKDKYKEIIFIDDQVSDVRDYRWSIFRYIKKKPIWIKATYKIKGTQEKYSCKNVKYIPCFTEVPTFKGNGIIQCKVLKKNGYTCKNVKFKVNKNFKIKKVM